MKKTLDKTSRFQGSGKTYLIVSETESRAGHFRTASKAQRQSDGTNTHRLLRNIPVILKTGTVDSMRLIVEFVHNSPLKCGCSNQLLSKAHPYFNELCVYLFHTRIFAGNCETTSEQNSFGSPVKLSTWLRYHQLTTFNIHLQHVY